MTVFLPFLAAFALLGSSMAAVVAQAALGLGDGPGLAFSLACGSCGWGCLVASALRQAGAEAGRMPSERAFLAAVAGFGLPWALGMAAGQAEHVPFGMALSLHALAAAAATGPGVVAAWAAGRRGGAGRDAAR